MNANSNLIQDSLLKDVPIYENYRTLKPVILYAMLKKGQMGAVYKGCHLRLNIDVAVKVMTPPAWIEPKELEVYINRFIREAQTAAGIFHQNLVNVVDVNKKHGIYYLIMEFIDGESVAERLKRRGPLTEIEALEIVKHASNGMAVAHDKGIIHRDIKPDNIMISRDGTIKVTDLGLAKAIDDNKDHRDELTIVGTIMGTPYFMSPEQTVSAKDVGPPSDVWSMGVTLYKLLTNHLPFSGGDLTDLIYNIRNSSLPDLAKINPKISKNTLQILDKSLDKESKNRYPNLKEMKEDVDRCLIAMYRKYQAPVDSFARSPIPDSKHPAPPDSTTISKVTELLEVEQEPKPADRKEPVKKKKETEEEKTKIWADQLEKILSRQRKKVQGYYTRLDDPKFKKHAKAKNRNHLNNLLGQIETHIENENHIQAESAMLTASNLFRVEEAKMQESSKNRPFIILNLVLIVAAVIIPLIILLAMKLF